MFSVPRKAKFFYFEWPGKKGWEMKGLFSVFPDDAEILSLKVHKDALQLIVEHPSWPVMPAQTGAFGFSYSRIAYDDADQKFYIKD